MKKLLINNMPKGHYSPAVISNNTVYISGQLSYNPKTLTVVDGGIKKEVECCLKKIEKILKEINLNKNNIVKCTLYLTSFDYLKEANEAYAEFFESHKPARSPIPIGKLNYGCNIEIEAIAEI